MNNELEYKFFREFHDDGEAILSHTMAHWKYCGISSDVPTREDFPDGVLAETKKLVDDSSLYAVWRNNSKVYDRRANQLTKLFWKNGYLPQWDGVVFEKILEQVENFKENSYSHPRGYDYPYSDTPSIAVEP